MVNSEPSASAGRLKSSAGTSSKQGEGSAFGKYTMGMVADGSKDSRPLPLAQGGTFANYNVSLMGSQFGRENLAESSDEGESREMSI